MVNDLDAEGAPVGGRYAKDLAEISEQNADMLAELRALREEQAMQSKKINSIMGEVAAIYRNLAEFVFSGPITPYEREQVNDDIEQELKDLGLKRIE